jgi:hypothetical protein
MEVSSKRGSPCLREEQLGEALVTEQQGQLGLERFCKSTQAFG